MNGLFDGLGKSKFVMTTKTNLRSLHPESKYWRSYALAGLDAVIAAPIFATLLNRSRSMSIPPNPQNFMSTEFWSTNVSTSLA